MGICEVIQKLIGSIEPVGETNTDNERYENLNTLTVLVDQLIVDINDIAMYEKNRPEHSRQKAGKFADNFLNMLCDYLIQRRKET